MPQNAPTSWSPKQRIQQLQAKRVSIKSMNRQINARPQNRSSANNNSPGVATTMVALLTTEVEHYLRLSCDQRT